MMKAVQILKPNVVEMIEIAIPEPKEDEVLIKVEASGICGTDIHILRGEYLGSYPVIPGHEFSGVIVKTGAKVTRFELGERVAVEPNIPCDNCPECLHNRQNFCQNWQAVGVTRPGGMAEYVVAPEKQVFRTGDLAFEQGAFVEPLSCVLYGLEHLNLRMGDAVAIVGAGPIGLQLLRAARQQGVTRMVMAERNPARLEFARAAGADEVVADLGDLPADSFDAVIDATGVPAVMARCLDFVRPGGKVLWFGVPPAGKEMTLEPFKIFRKGLDVMGSYTSLRNSYQAVDLLRTGRVRVDDLVSHRLSLSQFVHGCEMIEKGEDQVRKVMIFPGKEGA